MKSNPKVSVIIPCYNLGQYLDEAVESVLNQTFQDFEIIIINDGSTDKFTNNLLKNYNKPKTKVYKIENKGLPAARNFAISKAVGLYILPLDADDFIDETYLEKSIKILENNIELGYVTTWIQLFGTENYIWKTREFSLGDAFMENYTAVTSLFKKECWEKVGGYDENMTGYQDWDFWISILEKGYRGFVIEEPLFFYRKREGSMLSNSNKKRKSLLKYLINKHSETFYKNAENIFIERDAQIIDLYEKMSNSLLEKSLLISKKDSVINEKDAIIAEKDNIIAEKDNIINEKDRLLNEISTTLNNINQSVIIYPILVLRNKAKKTLRQIKLLFLRLEQSTIYFGRNLLKEDVKKYLRPFLRKKYRVRVVDADNKKWKYPLVSVITPYYNRVHTINETIESVLGQTFQDFEYIIVDDGSSDAESIKAFDEIDNPKIRKIKQKNQGVASARNRGISEARGKYILCLDSDDTIDPTYLEKAISIMELNPQYDIIYSNIKFFGLDSGGFCYESEFNAKRLIECNMLTTASIFRRKFWEKSSGYKTNLGFEDWEFWISLVEKGARAKLIPEFLFNYRKAENSRYIEDIKKTEENTRRIRGFHPHYLKNISEIAKQDKIKYIFKDENKYTNIGNPNQYLVKDGEKSKKSILFLMPWLTFGGAETVVYNLCSQIKEDFNISIITGIKSEHEWEYKFKEITNQIYHLPNLFESSEEYFEFVANYVKTRKIDVIHIVHNSSFYEMLPGLKRLYPKIKIVNTTFNTVADHFTNSIKCSNFIDIYTTDNSKVADAYKKERSLGSEKIKVIHNGIDCNEKFNPAHYNRLNERKKIGINDGDMAIYFIGRLSSEKNPNVFVKAAGKILKKHDKVKFFVIGDGPMRSEIEKLIKNIDNENISYLGYQTNISRYLSTADIFVLPSSIEGFPLSNVEAMSMGVCVISSDVGGVSDAIKDGETGFLMQPNSAEELAKKIEFVISQKDILEKISRNARESVEKNFSIEILADKYKKIYQSLYE